MAKTSTGSKSQGGAISSNTASLLEHMASQSRLSKRQQQELLSAASEGTLPSASTLNPERARQQRRQRDESPFPKPKPPSGLPTKRPVKNIVASGELQPEQFVGAPPGRDNEREKNELASKFEEVGLSNEEKREREEREQAHRHAKKEPLSEDELEERIEKEIEDRLEFLEEMRRHGKAKEYEQQIMAEVATRRNELRKLAQLAENQLRRLDHSDEGH